MPIGARLNAEVVSSSPSSACCGRMKQLSAEAVPRKPTFGSAKVTTAVVASGVSMLSMSCHTVRLGIGRSGSTITCQVKRTSSLVNGAPSCQVTSSRNRSV